MQKNFQVIGLQMLYYTDLKMARPCLSSSSPCKLININEFEMARRRRP